MTETKTKSNKTNNSLEKELFKKPYMSRKPTHLYCLWYNVMDNGV